MKTLCYAYTQKPMEDLLMYALAFELSVSQVHLSQELASPVFSPQGQMDWWRPMNRETAWRGRESRGGGGGRAYFFFLVHAHRVLQEQFRRAADLKTGTTGRSM